jgi:hypothetical protein
MPGTWMISGMRRNCDVPMIDRGQMNAITKTLRCASKSSRCSASSTEQIGGFQRTPGLHLVFFDFFGF